MNRFDSTHKFFDNTYFSQSFKNYPFLLKKRKTFHSLLFIFILVPFLTLLMLRSHYESVIGTNYQIIFNHVVSAIVIAFLILMPIVFSIEGKIKKTAFCSIHHLIYSKCELRKILNLIEQNKDSNLNTEHELYSHLKKLHSLIEQYSLLYVNKINTNQLKTMDFSLSFKELSEELDKEMSNFLAPNKLEELEFKIRDTNVECLDMLYRHKLFNLHEKCFLTPSVIENKIKKELDIVNA